MTAGIVTIEGRTYVRHQRGQERRTSRGHFEPLAYEDELIGQRCSECNKPLKAGQRPTMFAVGPTTPFVAQAAEHGQWYTALTVAMHEDCAWGDATDPAR